MLFKPNNTMKREALLKRFYPLKKIIFTFILPVKTLEIFLSCTELWVSKVHNVKCM